MDTQVSRLGTLKELRYQSSAYQPAPMAQLLKSSVNRLVGTGFASRYRLIPIAGFSKAQWVGVRPLHPLLSH